jgi:hypothetical protein
MIRKALIVLACLFGCLTPTTAQNVHGFTPCTAGAGAQTISASGTSSGVTLSTCGPSALLFNVGTQEAFYLLSSNNTAATTSDFSIPGNSYILLTVPNAGSTYYLTAITATSTTTIRISQGYAN